MELTSIINVGVWWLVFFLIGFTFLPSTLLLFNSFFDKGYIFSKILGSIIIGYIIWLLSSLKILTFDSFNIFLIIILSLALNLFVFYYKKLASIFQTHLKIFLVEEIFFFIGLLFWAYIKSFEPSIHGLEKFMDFGFINSILRTDYMPPKDLWLSPLTINYYYFGHFIGALLINLAGVDPSIGYNLILSSLFALTLTASFSIGANLYHFFINQSKSPYSILSGLLSSFLVTLGGNLHTIYAFFQTYTPADDPVPFWHLSPMFNFLGYWYPNATRFIPFTIHEFPLYSFVVSDLHGHVLNIPFVLLFIALLIKLFHSLKLHTSYSILLALLLAIFLMTNVLDGPIYLLGLLLILFSKNWTKSIQEKFSFLKISTQTFLIFIPIFIGIIIFSLPYWLTFTPFASGVGVLCAPDFLVAKEKIGPFLFEADHCTRSPFWMLSILWGFPYFILFGFIFFNLKFRFDLEFKIKNLKFNEINPTDFLTLTLVFFATILILIPELFYAKDIYPAHYRANTVFKFGYQAFIILGLISGYMITRIITLPKKTILYTLYSILLFLLFLLVVIYPYFAINSYFNGLKDYKGLNGISYLNDLYPDDYQAVLWIRENISGQPVILESQGDSYTDHARISSNTGLPTVIGWPVHEWLWRGSYDEAGRRSIDVTTLYESADIEFTKELLKKYNVEFIFLGDLERQKYLNLNEDKFNTLGEIIFQSGSTRIYQLYPL